MSDWDDYTYYTSGINGLKIGSKIGLKIVSGRNRSVVRLGQSFGCLVRVQLLNLDRAEVCSFALALVTWVSLSVTKSSKEPTLLGDDDHSLRSSLDELPWFSMMVLLSVVGILAVPLLWLLSIVA